MKTVTLLTVALISLCEVSLAQDADEAEKQTPTVSGRRADVWASSAPLPTYSGPVDWGESVKSSRRSRREKTEYTMQYGYGAGSIGRSFSLNVNVESGKEYYGFRYMHQWDNPDVSLFRTYQEDGLKYEEASLLYGYRLRSRFVRASVGLGIGIVFGTEMQHSSIPVVDRSYEGQPMIVNSAPAPYATSEDVNFCLPAEINVSIHPLPWLGLGGKAFGNLNSFRSYMGYMFYVQLGV